MTTLACWAAVDSRGPSAVYLASDSRISWTKTAYWDHGRKMFRGTTTPDLFGYVGSAVLPVNLLPQVTCILEHASSPTRDAEPARRFGILEQMLRARLGTFPRPDDLPGTIIHCARRSSGMSSTFEIRTIAWTAARSVEVREYTLPAVSDIVHVMGSGEPAVVKWVNRWQAAIGTGKSRGVFGAICDAIDAGDDARTGGAPQLTGLFRSGAPREFGMRFRGGSYFAGAPVEPGDLEPTVEWRDELFQLWSWDGAEWRRGPQRHHRPGGLGRSGH